MMDSHDDCIRSQLVLMYSELSKSYSRDNSNASACHLSPFYFELIIRSYTIHIVPQGYMAL